MREYVKRLFEAWQNGKKYARSGCGRNGASMTLDGDTFYSYRTPIAHWKNGIFWLNSDKYSVTTTRQQTSLKWMCYTYKVTFKEVTEKELREIIG